MRVFGTLAVVALATSTLSTTAGPLKNAGFEDGETMPTGWHAATHGDGFILSRDTGTAHTGIASARIEAGDGHGDRACFLQKSSSMPAAKAVRLTFWYKGDGKSTGILRFRSAPGHQVENDTYATHFFSCTLPQKDWCEFVFDAPVPKDASEAGSFQVEVILYQKAKGVVWYDDVSLTPLDNYTLHMLEDSSPLCCPLRPADGTSVQQNPPDFWWPPDHQAETYELQFSQTEDFTGPATRNVESIGYSVYSHNETLSPGTWFWRRRCRSGNGDISEWSPTSRFTILEDAVPFPVPSPPTLLDRIPVSHPRVYTTAKTQGTFAEGINGDRKAWWQSFSAKCDGWLQQAIMKEPGEELSYRMKGGKLDDAMISNGQKLRSYCSSATSRMQQLAFAYLLSKDEKYGHKAVAQALEISSWDPNGITGYRNHDQVFRDIAWKTACVYDWCYDLMSAEERQRTGEAVLARGKQLFRNFMNSDRPIYEYPFDSHGITAFGFLGVCAIALVHDFPEADDWFRFIVATYPGIFPPWGGEEGGWCQGSAYWKWSQPFAWFFFDALKSSTGLDLYQKAFCRNNGWFKLYTHPPFCDRHHFGDGNHGAPGVTDQSNMAHFACIYGNPYFQWYAKQFSTWPNVSPYSYWWDDAALSWRPPADLPQGRCFPDIGWVAMHSDLSDPDDIMLVLKSSWYGSFNHSHADQNHFVLYAYGEPLIIDSGYYDWYGSPHDRGWTRTTRAHNTILVNGEGQPIFDITAKGKIRNFFTFPPFDYACGDAREAYKGKLTRFLRHVLFLRPDVFLIVDDLGAPEPSTFTFPLHAEEEMQVAEESRKVTITRGNAQCRIQFIEPASLQFEQTDQFAPPPSTNKANEWHLYASTRAPAQRQRFVSLIHPSRKSDKGVSPVLEVQTNQAPEGTSILIRKSGNDWCRVTIPDETEQVWNVQSLSTEPGKWQAEISGGAVAFTPATIPRDVAPPKVGITVENTQATLHLENVRTPNGGHLFWGRANLNSGFYRVAASTPNSFSSWLLAGNTVTTGSLIHADGPLDIQLRTRTTDDTVTLNLTSVDLSGTPATAQVIVPFPDLDNRCIKLEAETKTQHGGGHAHVYSHRPFLSGGKGLETAVAPGQWTEWTFTTPARVTWQLVFKGAIFEDHADRMIEIDGVPVATGANTVRFPFTGGFGATPDQWSHHGVARTDGTLLGISLDAGTHTLRSTLIEGKQNLDYIVLMPQGTIPNSARPK